MVLAHIEREPGSRLSQKELSKARFLTSDRPQTLPGPGVYARANSVAAPALLPDGSVTPESFATGIEPQEADQMPRPTGREQLGSPDAALGTLDPAPSDRSADR
jgi:NADH-quinone oxidoreductase subunit J